MTGYDTPATLSPQLVALIPDAENTLIVTDSLAMDAITAAYTPGEAAVQALQAGCDVLLMPNSLPEAYAAVLEAVQNGTISEERLDRSVNKILPSAFRASSAIPSSCSPRWTASSRRALSKLSPRRALKRRTIPI